MPDQSLITKNISHYDVRVSDLMLECSSIKKKDIRANLGNITRSISHSNPQLYSNYARKEIDSDLKPHEPKIVGKKFFDGLTAYTLVAGFELDKD